MNTDREQRRLRRNIIILTVEVIVMIALVIVLSTVIVPATRVGKVNLDDELLYGNMNDGVTDNTRMKGYLNIALFGVDSTRGELSAATRSDSIIIASINNETGEIKLLSVYRDTYLNQGNDRYGKCNAAYAKGGPERAISMLNMNMDLSITDFVTIGFQGLTDVINELGGITVNVEEDAVQHINNYQLTMARDMGIKYDPVTMGGPQVLNGLQATAYSRVRYIAGNDFARARHQREVIMATLEKAKGASVSQLHAIAEKVFEETYTSLDLSEILTLLSGISGYNITAQDGFPQMDKLVTGNIGQDGSCVVPVDLKDNVEWLHMFFFEAEEYEVTEEVKGFSDTIREKTAAYIE